jgi:ABC-2 type transport system permease protein
MLFNPRGTLTLFTRETKRFLKVYLQTIFAPVVSNLLYFAIFGLSLHRAIPDIQGISYLQFLVPGLITMGIINNAYQNPSSSLIIMKYQGLISDLMTVPLKRFEILLAFVSSAVIRGFIVGTMTFLTAIFFVDFTYAAVGVIFASAFLIALFFAFIGVIVGIWANEFDKTAFIQNFVLQPLIFLGGVFYSLNSLPEVAQTISKFNPISYMINLIRYGFTGVAEISIGLSFAVVGSATLILGLTAYLLLRSGWRLQK